ncbi:MAG: hypothetical protein Q8K75_04705 [Chlamydiales bacterium]|nr:hypothetical protein [Chlamydiales bacterium]
MTKLLRPALNNSCKSCLWAIVLVAICLTGCQKNCYELEPTICFSPPKRLVACLPTSFPPLTPQEKSEEWSKELIIGNHFARDLDLYRAITAYKRANVLLPCENVERRLQIDYCIILAYYIGGKYQEAVEAFECSELVSAGPCFPAFGDLLILLYDAYSQDCRHERAEVILELINKYSPETKSDLVLYHSVIDGDISCARFHASEHPRAEEMLPYFDEYCCCAKSVKKAQTLNAVLPGAGYLYVGQKQTALTSFLLNTLFTAAAVCFFDNGNIPMGIILTSLEAGWYFGGINGAGLAAKEYNERLFENHGREMLQGSKLFPVLMFEHAF